METVEHDPRFNPGYWRLSDARFEIWDRGDAIAEITAAHGIVAFVKANPTERDCDWENGNEPVTAFPGYIRMESGLKLPDGMDTFVESVEHLGRILAACEIIPRRNGAHG
ncbi:hypothetical protein G6L37_06985 [Agrobacterium rubi]|nr:hypothetical protein [Agrobacterium rubi]NTF25110.1 hypothetical protein [Agrobacterium rubi]